VDYAGIRPLAIGTVGLAAERVKDDPLTINEAVGTPQARTTTITYEAAPVV
jgi:hypothetical protein